ncbi:MAG: hypothetical protein FWG34_14920 [Oscillospiraceae bacterium]|nr:hypothetical protein [Oscillospiraceae bacterium]
MGSELFEEARIGVKEQNLERQLISLVFEKDEQIERLNAEIEKLSAEKNGQQKSESLLAEKDVEIVGLNDKIAKMLAEKDEQNGQTEQLKAEIAKLGAEKGEKGQAETALAEKDEQIEWLNARIRRLVAEKDEKNTLIERLTAERDELIRASSAATEKKQAQFSLENTGSLAEASLSVSGVLKAAQEAADVYLQNIKLLEAEKIAAAEKIETEAKERAENIVRDAELRRMEIEEAENKALGDLRSVSFLYMDFIDKSHSALHEMVDRYKLTKFAQNEDSGAHAENQ